MNELHEYAETHGQTKFPHETENEFLKRIEDFREKREKGLAKDWWRRENVTVKDREGD